VLAPDHHQVGPFLGQGQVDRLGLVVIIGPVAQGDRLLDQGRDAGQVDARDAIEVATGQIELHQVDRVDLDVDLRDVAVIQGDAGRRGRRGGTVGGGGRGGGGG